MINLWEMQVVRYEIKSDKSDTLKSKSESWTFKRAGLKVKSLHRRLVRIWKASILWQKMDLYICLDMEYNSHCIQESELMNALPSIQYTRRKMITMQLVAILTESAWLF